MKTYSQFIAEGNPTTRMLSKANDPKKVTANISADRGPDESENRKKRKSLEKNLQKQGIGYKKGVGEYKYKSDDGKEGTGREVTYNLDKPKTRKGTNIPMSKTRFGKIVRRAGRAAGQESVITKDGDKPAKLHYTDGSKTKSETLGKSKPGKHPQGYGETSGTKIRSGKLPKETTKPSYHYG